MSPLLDNLLVVAALLASAVYALFKLGPRSLRRAALSRVASWAARAPGWFGVRSLAARLDAAAMQPSGTCGGCDNCGSEGGTAQGSPPASLSASQSASLSASGSEIKVPLASIGRRQQR
ncbi:MAG: DUF6587 family protein [Steroidobacteraceae bacterium]|jgi:hypothetical protein